MNRPEYSLSLDSVICRRCNTVSAAEEATCPSCGADRQGAIFTSHADTVAARAPEQLDIVDLSDSNWLQRRVRRKMLTAYPNFIEPGESQETLPRKSARTTIAVLVGSVVASIAAGGYLYSTLDDNAAPAHAEPGISAAGSIRDGASGALATDKARHASLARSRAEAGPASASVAEAGHEAALHPGPAANTPSATKAVASASASVAVGQPSNKPIEPVIVSAQRAEKPETQAAASATAFKPPQAVSVATTGSQPQTASPTIATKPTAPALASAQSTSPPKPTQPQTAAPIIATKSATPALATTQKAPTREPSPSNPVAATPPSKSSTASLEKTAAPIPEPLPAAVAHSIASVQQALNARDLTAARRHMRGLYASLQRSPEIQQLAADLSRQERARDAAIVSARSCANGEDAVCALRNARRAVSLDPRNAQAQATLRRALAVQNETNTEYFRQASGIPKPVVPTMTYDGRWSANSHGAHDASNITLFGWGVPTVAKGRGDAH